MCTAPEPKIKIGDFMDIKYSGIVSAYYPSRKFGFILLDDGSSRFFHVSNFHLGKLSAPVLGARVGFELGNPVSPEQAVNIVLIPTVAPLVNPLDAVDLLAGSGSTSQEVKS
jgi:cold shock CspA family protein